MKGIKYITQTKDSIFAKLQIRENPDEAFENAIRKGMKDPEDWMYMYSENGMDYFKHECTRKYTSYKQYSIIDIIKTIIKQLFRKEKLRNE